ncbi:hypothetical protein [Streptomyces laurentii]|uniref:hypothetical protein n=1 Tax=Streptomyces laurentii TaxID=39478 RepID=UPI00368DD41E
MNLGMFDSPDDVPIGAVVFDKDWEMPAEVAGKDGYFVDLRRPTGRKWRARYSRLRPASAWECRQLIAVGRLHIQRQKGAQWT